jgi:Fe-S-cluster-containing hydrogenase component 2
VNSAPEAPIDNSCDCIDCGTCPEAPPFNTMPTTTVAPTTTTTAAP